MPGYPPCQFSETSPDGKYGPCDQNGKMPNGESCDCDKASIIGFEGWGCSHEVAVMVNTTLARHEYSYMGTIPALDELHQILDNNAWPNDQVAAQKLTEWCEHNRQFALKSVEEYGYTQYL